MKPEMKKLIIANLPYLNIVHLLRLPADSKIQISGAKIYWM